MMGTSFQVGGDHATTAPDVLVGVSSVGDVASFGHTDPDMGDQVCAYITLPITSKYRRFSRGSVSICVCLY
jgi:hypothetical protein